METSPNRSYEVMLCPMPGCEGELYLKRTDFVPIFTDMNHDDFGPKSATTSSWEIICTEDHRIMFPTRHDDDCQVFGEHCEVCAEEGEIHDDLADLLLLIERISS